MQYWIDINDKLPEEVNEIVEVAIDDFSPVKTHKVIVLTNKGTVTDNRRVKMMIGEKEWAWLMGYDGEYVTHWTYFVSPDGPMGSKKTMQEGIDAMRGLIKSGALSFLKKIFLCFVWCGVGFSLNYKAGLVLSVISGIYLGYSLIILIVVRFGYGQMKKVLKKRFE